MRLKTRILNELIIHGFTATSNIQTLDDGSYHLLVTNSRCNYICTVLQHKTNKHMLLYKFYVGCDSFVTP